MTADISVAIPKGTRVKVKATGDVCTVYTVTYVRARGSYTYELQSEHNGRVLYPYFRREFDIIE